MVRWPLRVVRSAASADRDGGDRGDECEHENGVGVGDPVCELALQGKLAHRVTHTDTVLVLALVTAVAAVPIC